MPLPLFETPKESKLNRSIQNVQDKYGKSMIKWGSDLLFEDFKVKQKNVSPRYTTEWDELLEVG